MLTINIKKCHSSALCFYGFQISPGSRCSSCLSPRNPALLHYGGHNLQWIRGWITSLLLGGNPLSARDLLPPCVLYFPPLLSSHPSGKCPDPGGCGGRAQPPQAHVLLPDQPLNPGHSLHHDHCPQDAVPVPAWRPLPQLPCLLIANVPLPKLHMFRSLHPCGHGL